MAVKQQIRKIRHLKKYQPKYKHAHEKAVFKAAAIVKDTKNIVNEIDHQVRRVDVHCEIVRDICDYILFSPEEGAESWRLMIKFQKRFQTYFSFRSQNHQPYKPLNETNLFSFIII